MRHTATLLCLATLAAAQTRIVIQAGAVIDGKGAVHKNQQIVVEDGRIVSAGPGKAKPDYDLRRCTLMPGWIDTHVHLNWHFDANHKNISGGREPVEDTRRYTAANAKATLEGGFTTVQSVGAMVDGWVRDQIAAGAIPGPRVLTSLRQIQANSGDPDALRALVRRTKRL